MHLVYFLHFWKLIVCFKNPSQVCLFVPNQYHARDSNGLGVIVKDSNGLTIASLVQKISYPGSVEMVETLAARRAVILATEIGTWKIEVEGDSEKIIKAINQWGPNFTPYGHIIEDIKRSVEKLQWSHFRHTRSQEEKAIMQPMPWRDMQSIVLICMDGNCPCWYRRCNPSRLSHYSTIKPSRILLKKKKNTTLETSIISFFKPTSHIS